MVSVKVNDSWDDDHSDLDEEEEEDEEEEKQKPKQDQTQKQDTGAADISSLPQRPVFRTVTQPPTSLATKEPNQSKVPTVEELLAEQFQNGQRPVITSLSISKSKVAVEKKQTTSSTNFTNNTDQDDIFASMGLSTIPKIKSDFRQQHLTVSDVKVALPANNVAAAKNYSTPSLAKNAVPLSNYHSSIDIEEEPDWGDDEDLDDLLND
jgi:flagellar biosynthesis GTPase FlhF